jgi:hypothetical protein
MTHSESLVDDWRIICRGAAAGNVSRAGLACLGEARRESPVGLILRAEKGADEAHYALDGLPNEVLAAAYRLALPDEDALVQELGRTRRFCRRE